MATITWGGASGDWATAADWVGGVAPGAADTALINGTNTFTLKMDETEPVTGVDLTDANAKLAIESGGTLSLKSTMTLGAGIVQLDSGGLIKGGTIEAAGGSVQFNYGTLSGVTFEGALDMSAARASLQVAGTGLTLTAAGGVGAGQIDLTGYEANLGIDHSSTLANAAFHIGNGVGDELNVDALAVGGVTLTLASNLVLDQTGRNVTVQIGAATDRLVNLGQISAGYSGGSLRIAGRGAFTNGGALAVSSDDEVRFYLGVSSCTNYGDISVSSGGILLARASSFTNTGTLLTTGKGSVLSVDANSFTNMGTLVAKGTGSVLVIGASVYTSVGTFTNVGVLLATGTGAAIDLDTSLASASLVKATASNGGVIGIDGTLDNTGVTLSVGKGAKLGTLEVYRYGVITGGTIADGGSGLVGDGGTLSGVTFEGALDMSADAASLEVAGTGLTLTGVGGVGAGQINLAGDRAFLNMENSQTLANGAIYMGNAKGYFEFLDVDRANAGGVTLTLAPSLDLIHTGSYAEVEIGAASDRLVNQGQINANCSGGQFYLIGAGAFTNSGILSATNGDTLTVGVSSFTNRGTLLVNGVAVCSFTGALTNTGVVVASGGTLNLQGALVNSGKVNLNAGKLIVGAAGATLSGAGQVNLNNSAANIVVGSTSTATLINIDDRIAGAGQLGGGSMILINQAAGRIIGNQSVALTIDTGKHTIANGGLIENVGKGGTLVVSAVRNTGTLKAATAGTLTLAGTVSGGGVGQITGGTLYVQQAFAENVTFIGSTGVFELGDSQAYAGKVTGLSTAGTNSLDLADITFTSGVTKASYSGTSASGTLTVTDGIHTAKIALIGDYTASTFTVSSDGHGGTKVVDPAAPPGPAPLAQAMAGFQHGPPAHLAATAAYRLPRFPTFHARA